MKPARRDLPCVTPVLTCLFHAAAAGRFTETSHAGAPHGAEDEEGDTCIQTELLNNLYTKLQSFPLKAPRAGPRHGQAPPRPDRRCRPTRGRPQAPTPGAAPLQPRRPRPTPLGRAAARQRRAGRLSRAEGCAAAAAAGPYERPVPGPRVRGGRGSSRRRPQPSSLLAGPDASPESRPRSPRLRSALGPGPRRRRGSARPAGAAAAAGPGPVPPRRPAVTGRGRPPA